MSFNPDTKFSGFVGAVDEHLSETAADDVHDLAGAVIADSGSNDNGSWTKFGNGLMICTHILATTNTEQETSGSLYFIRYGAWTYPQPFIGVPSVSMAVVGNVAQMPGNRQITATGVSEFYGYRAAAFSGTISAQSMCVTAIGRWE